MDLKIITMILYIIRLGGFWMFIRTERSVQEFFRFYPIVSILVIIHLLLWLVIDFLQLPIGYEIYLWGVGNNYFIHEGQYWRLITSIFLHGGLMHALFNSFSLVLFGPALEQMLGKGRFIFAYLGAGLIANIATFAIHPLAFYEHLGASGALFGLFGIYIFMVVFRKSLIDQQNAQIITVIAVLGLIMTFIQPNVNVYAHIFGFIGGFILAPLVLFNIKPYSPWRYRHSYQDDTIQFNPNRWNKKRRIPRQVKKNMLWIILGILVLFGLLNRLGILY